MFSLVLLLIVSGISLVCRGETTDARVVVIGNRCGLFALASACGVLHADFRYAIVAPILDRDQRDSSFEDLSRAAETLGLASRGVECLEGFPVLTTGKVVAIVPVRSELDGRHFVTVTTGAPGNLWIIDFPNSAQRTTPDVLRQEHGWDGKALLIAKSPAEFQGITPPSAIGRWLLLAGVGLSAIASWFVLSKREMRPRHQNRSASFVRRPGFTIVELLVSMTVIAVLLGLGLPAIFAAQSRARQIECLNRIRQQGQAIVSYDATHQHLPTVRLGDAENPNPSGAATILVSWQVHLLPFVEQANIWKTIDPHFNDPQIYLDPPILPEHLRSRISLFQCPSDTVPTGGTSYRGCTGTSPGLHSATGTTIANSSEPGWISGLTRRPADVSDGLSNTIFLSERVAGDYSTGDYYPLTDIALVGNGALMLPSDAWALCQSVTLAVPGTFSSAGATWFAGGYGRAWYNHVLPPNARIPDCTSGLTLQPSTEGAYAARSFHPLGVNVAFGDGSGRFINNAVDLVVWRGLGTIRAREVIQFGE